MIAPTMLQLQSTAGENGRIIVNLAAPDGERYALNLSVIDVGLLASALFGAQREALDQPPIGAEDDRPDGALPIHALAFGAMDDGQHQLLRVTVAPGIRQDFYAATGSEAGIAIERFSEIASQAINQPPRRFRPRNPQ